MSRFKIMGVHDLKKKILNVFTIYGYDSHLDHSTKIVYINFRSAYPKEVPTLTGKGVSFKQMFEIVVYVHVHSIMAGADRTHN